MGAEGKIVLSVNFDEAQAQKTAGQLKSTIEKKIGNFNLDNLFDDKKIQQSVQNSINNINNILSKSKFKNLDFASFIPKTNAFLSDKKNSEAVRSQVMSNFEYRLSVLDKYGSKDIMPLLKNEDIMNGYMKDLTNIVDFVKSISGLKTSEQNRLIKDLSKGDADDITSAFALKDIEKKYGNNIKYKVKPKDVMSLLETAYEKLDTTNEESLRNFLGLYNRGKYLAKTDKTIKGTLRNSFKEFETNYKQDVIGVREGHPELFNEMERVVLGMSKDFDNLYNTKYKGKVLDTSDLIKGLKIDRSISKISDTQTDSFPTTSRQIVDSLTETKTDVKELENEIKQVEKKAEQVEEKAEEAHNIANEIKETKKKDNKSSKESNAVNTDTDTTKSNNQDESLVGADSIQQVENEVEDELEKVENDIDKLEKEKEALKFQKKITAEAKQKLEKENKEINEVINKNYKDDSKTNNYNRLKNQYENYEEKAQKSYEESKKLDSFETNSPEWFSQLVSFQEASAEEKIAWMKYYKAYDVAKNGKNKVAESRLKKFAPENLETEFDNDSYEIYLQNLKERYKKNTEEINGLDKDIDEYFQKINKLNEKINDINLEENDIVNNNKPQSNNQKDSTQNYILPDDLMSNIYEGINNTNDADNSNINNIAQAEGELENNTNKANSALEKQTDITNNLAKTTENLMYHMGHIDDEKTILSNTFGQELQNPNKYNIGTGLYTTKSSKDYSKSVLSQEDLDEYYAIDVSELNMYEAHAEETAKEFYDFVHHLEQFCIMMGSNFEGFDDNLENIDEESLYSTAQKLFPNIEQAFIDFDEFDDFINEMINYVSKSGINADGTINPVKMRLFQKEFGTDDIKTRFLKELDYQGVDLSGTSYGNQLGSIIFDSLDKSKILVSGKNIEQIAEEAANRIRQEQDSKPEPSETTTPTNKPTSTKKNVEEQQELKDAVEKTTDAIKNQQEVLSQGKEVTPSQSSTKKNESLDEIEQPDDNKKKSKPIAKPKPKTNNKDDSRETPITNEINQSENNSANEGIGESNSFKLITGSAEEAAEAKRKFVEANKDVLQSIIASTPKIKQEADALEKVKEAQNESSTKTSKTESEKEKDRKRYFDFEAMPNDLIEQRYNEISPFPVVAKGVSLATNKLNKDIETAIDGVELLEQLHADYDKVFSEDTTGQLSFFDDVPPENNWGQQLEQNAKDIANSISNFAIEGQLSFQDLEEAERQAILLETQYAKLRNKKDFIQGEDVSEKFLEAYDGISTEKTQELFKTIQELKQAKASLQDFFDKEGNFSGDFISDLPQAQNAYDTYIKLLDIVKELKLEIGGQYSEETAALKLKEDAEKAEKELQQLKTTIEQTYSKISGSKQFIQGKDLNDNYLNQYGNKESTKNLDKLKETFQQLENIKFQLKLAFDDEGNLLGDPTQTQLLLDRYDYLTNKIERLKLLIESPSSGENILKEIIKDEEKTAAETEKLTGILEKAYSKLINPEKITSSTEKFLKPYFDLPTTETTDQLINTVERIQNISKEISSSFNEQGELIGNPREVQELIIEYNSLIKQVDVLKEKISSPLSEENIALKIAKDTEKAQIKIDKSTQQIEEKLNNLKQKIDTTLGKSNLFEAQTEKTINTYGAFNGEEGQRTDLIASDKLGEKYGDRFAKQQEQVQQLVDKLRDYRTAIKELEALRTSDDTTLEQLTEANDKVKNLKDSITNLSQTIKTSGIANASEEQLGALKNRFEIFLEKNPNLTSGIRQQIQEYINILNSGASVSKTRYASMTADLNKFTAAQTSGRTIWEQMVGKMREGIAFLATKFSFYEIFNQFRQGFEVIHQFDDALTEMMKVSDETRLSLERYQKTTFNTADAIGTSALQIQNSTADFMRLGETLNEAAESAKSANVLMNVSEFQSIDEATKSLIAMSAAYDDLSKMNIIDKLNEVGNNFSISTSEAAEALQSSASALQTAGNSMDESLALITAGNAVVQDANKVGIKDAQR